MRRAKRFDVLVDYADTPSSSVKNGVLLGLPGVRSDAGMHLCRATHATRSASYAQGGPAAAAPPFCRRRSSIGTLFSLAFMSLMPIIVRSAHGYPLLSAAGSIHRIDAHVRSRVESNSSVCGLPISPPCSSRLCTSSFTTPRDDHLS
eukprot:5917624-Pleurochrysis_carterae.AAC.2